MTFDLSGRDKKLTVPPSSPNPTPVPSFSSVGRSTAERIATQTDRHGKFIYIDLFSYETLALILLNCISDYMNSRLSSVLASVTGGGVLSGKVGTGMCGPDRLLFRPLRFSNGPFFYLKIGLDIGRIFAKCVIFVECFLLFYL